MAEKILVARCPSCNNIVAVSRKIKGLKRSDWEGMAMEFLEDGLIVNLSSKMPEDLPGCIDGCKLKNSKRWPKL